MLNHRTHFPLKLHKILKKKSQNHSGTRQKTSTATICCTKLFRFKQMTVKKIPHCYNQFRADRNLQKSNETPYHKRIKFKALPTQIAFDKV